MWDSYHSGFREKNIPEINDFNVLIKYQRTGMGSKLMDAVRNITRNQYRILGEVNLKRVNYANALILDELSQQVLLVRNGSVDSFYWSFPGGGVEKSETLEQAVVREVREETGLNIITEGLYSVREVLFKDKNEHALIFTFVSKIIDGGLGIFDPDHEILEVKWMDIHTANKLMPYIPKHIIMQENININSAFYYYHGEV